MLEESLRNFGEQLTSEPKIANKEKIRAYGKVIACGMGGSRLAAGFLRTLHPELNLQIWNDYGLPAGYQRDSFVIVTSYSGNTEEAIGNFIAAQEAGLQTAVVTSGGDLLNLAKQRGIPHVQVPAGYHPRMAVGYMLTAIAALLGDHAIQNEIKNSLSGSDPADFENAGKAIAAALHQKGPIIYSSRANRYLAEHWKIAFNENAKAPAVWNVLPELAHNELAAMPPKEHVVFILLRDPSDHQRIQVKFGELEKILKENGYEVLNVNFGQGNETFKIFHSYILANWSSLYLAKSYDIDPDNTDAIEDFKKRISQ